MVVSYHVELVVEARCLWIKAPRLWRRYVERLILTGNGGWRRGIQLATDSCGREASSAINSLQPTRNSLKKQKSCSEVYIYRLVLHSPYKFPLAYGETMTMMTPYGVIGWERGILWSGHCSRQLHCTCTSLRPTYTEQLCCKQLLQETKLPRVWCKVACSSCLSLQYRCVSQFLFFNHIMLLATVASNKVALCMMQSCLLSVLREASVVKVACCVPHATCSQRIEPLSIPGNMLPTTSKDLWCLVQCQQSIEWCWTCGHLSWLICIGRGPVFTIQMSQPFSFQPHK